MPHVPIKLANKDKQISPAQYLDVGDHYVTQSFIIYPVSTKRRPYVTKIKELLRNDSNFKQNETRRGHFAITVKELYQPTYYLFRNSLWAINIFQSRVIIQIHRALPVRC